MRGVTIPAVMRAVVLLGHGGYDQLALRHDIPVPTVGANDVLIKVGASAVNNTDINTRIGWYSKTVAQATDAGAALGIDGAGDDGWSGAAFQFPRIQGADACGVIMATGAEVDPDRVGERVLIEPAFHGRGRFDIRYFGSEVDGGFAEYTAVPARHAYRVDSPLSDTELASFPCAYATAENILTRIGLQAGERVLITGASGGVGSAAVQLAKRRGADVTAIAAAAKADAVRALGASQVVARDVNLVSQFGHEYFDAAVDIVGGPQFGEILGVLKRGGRYGVSGAISGPVVDLDLRTLYLKDLRLIGCTVLEPDVFANLVGYIERGEVRPVVAATYSLADIVTAQEAFLTKQHVGKIVLKP